MTLAQQNGITEFPYVIKDANDNVTYYEEAGGYWSKAEYNANGKVIYYENSNGALIDERPKKVNHTKVKITI
jgi:phosphoribulokinase